jgi:ankyrin repeat protein
MRKRLCAGLLVWQLFNWQLQGGDDARLAEAAQQGDAQAVRVLLSQKAAVNGRQGDGSTALHWAAQRDDLPLVQLLLGAGADPNATTRNGALTPLDMAAQNGSAGVMAALLKAGADPKITTTEGATVLMTASASGNTDAVQLLLDHGADPNAREKTYGQTALMFAAALNRAPVIRLLLAHHADPSIATHLTTFERIRLDVDGNVVTPGGKKPEQKEPEKKEPEKAAAPADPKTQQIEALTKQVQTLTKRLDEMEKAAKPAPGAPEETAAKANGGKAGDVVFQGPREVGATVTGGMSALLFAARDGHLEAARELLDGGANINQVASSDRTSPLVMAIINGHLDLAKFLLNRGALSNLATTAGLTPLIATIDVQWAPHAWFPQPNLTQEKTSYLDLMKGLLAHGANPDSRLVKKLWFRGLAQDPSWVDPAGATAFWRAAQATDAAAMRVLVSASADPHLPNLSGDTPLMVAAGIGWMANHTANASNTWVDAVKYCVELGEDVNAVDNRGYTSLHGAAYVGNNEMVLYLVDHGAKLGAKTKAGDTIADMANGPTRFGLPHAETVALLEKLGSVNSHNCRSDQCLPAPKEDKKPAKKEPTP